MLWIFTILIILITVLYFMGDENPDTSEKSGAKEQALPIVKKIEPILSNTETFQVKSSSSEQVFKYSGDVKILLPPKFAEQNQSLTVSKVKVDKSILKNQILPLKIIDITLDGGKQPSKPIEVAFSFNPDDLDSALTPEEQLTAFRWDEEGGGWVNLATHIDEKTHTISVLADHFSIIGAFWLAGKIVAAGIVVSSIAEKLLNDVYITPEKDFRILYSKKEIEKNSVLNDFTWRYIVKKSGTKYKKGVPHYIQDIGSFLESALKRYTDVYKFKNPAGEYSVTKSTGYHKSKVKRFKKIIIVKIDSYFSKLGGGNSSYDPIFDRLHIPTSSAKDINQAKTTLSHELFHAIQALYYSKAGMKNPYYKWWLEATAEYAAFNISGVTPFKGMDEGCGSNYLNYSLNSVGLKEGHGWWGKRDYEYLTSLWIKYLVDEGMNFKEMVENDASDYSAPLISLGKYMSAHHQLVDDVYEDFANWMVFSKNGGLKKYPVAKFDKGSKAGDLIAVKRNKLTLSTGKKVSYTFDMSNQYSSKTWAIKFISKSERKKKEKKPVIIEIKDKTPGININLFLLPEGQRFLDPPKPLLTIFEKEKPVMITVNKNDILYISSTTGGLQGHAEVVVKDGAVLLEIDPPEIPNAIAREANYFTITAKNIPKEIEKVDFAWDYNDGSEIGENNFVTVSEGEAIIKISHRYEEQKKEKTYPLKVVLKDSHSGFQLADARAMITLSLPKTELLVTPRHSTGPPGAAFDLKAKVSREGTYRFIWEIEGFDEAITKVGKESGIAPIINKTGEYEVTVKLYNPDSKFLAQDKVLLSVRPNDKIKLNALIVDESNPVEKWKKAVSVYPGNTIRFIVNVNNPAYKYVWKVSRQGFGTYEKGGTGNYGWGHVFMLKTGQEEYPPGGEVGLGSTTVKVKVYNNNTLIGEDSWSFNVKDFGSYRNDDVMPDGDE